MRRKGWSDLPPDLLREIAGRLHVAADFVSFLAVCKPWRNSRDLLSRTMTTSQFLPWLLVPTESFSPLKLRCVFSKSSYRVLPPPYPRRTNWVCRADGATVQYLTVQQLRPTLHDPITGACTDLPLFPYMCWEKNPCGIVYGDGTTLLYDTSVHAASGWVRFRAALLRPGDENWTLVNRTFEATGKQGELCAAYHGGRILVTAEASICRVIVTDGGGDMLVPRPWMPGEHSSSSERYSYIIESHGELLWVLVQVRSYYRSRYHDQADRLFMSVHALEETSAPEQMLWVRKEGSCLADRVLFLGSPNSFAVDASLLGGQGGCAYLSSKVFLGLAEQFGVLRYSFVDNKTEFIERMPLEQDTEKCTWLVPNPTITPIQEIIGRKREAQTLKEQQAEKTAPVSSPSRIFHIDRHYEHSFKVLVHDLPPKVKESQLRLFFSEHGKVSSTEIVYYENTKTSRGFGVVKMATMHAHEDDAVAALEELDFDGCSLEVILVYRRRRRKSA